MRFSGQYFDVETGKHYNFNRNYNPITGRYVQSDPIGLDGGLNLYGYVQSNPLLFEDANGLLLTWDSIFLNTIRRISEWSVEGSKVYHMLKNDGINHHIYNKDYVGSAWLGSVKKHYVTVNFKDIFEHQEYECKKASIERLLAYEMIHAAYKLPSSPFSQEAIAIKKENEIMEDVEFDNIDRAITNNPGC